MQTPHLYLITNQVVNGPFAFGYWKENFTLTSKPEYLSTWDPFWTNQPLATHQWHYVGASYDYTTGMASIWANGVRVLEKSIGAGITLGTQDNVRVGVRAKDPRYLTARIAAMQFYDVALTAMQINKVKRLGLGNHEYDGSY